MAKQVRVKNISLSQNAGTFTALFKRISGGDQESDISILRQILSNEKAKLLHVCKTKKPESIYKLAKLLGRDFKAVRHDIKILEQYGFIDLISSHKSGRERLTPIVDLDQLVITVNI